MPIGYVSEFFTNVSTDEGHVIHFDFVSAEESEFGGVVDVTETSGWV